MGWLRDMMAVAPRPFRSYDALAEAALAHPDWPSDTQPRVRSLAAIFSRLDRQLDLEWLVDRPSAQQALTELLGASLPDFVRAGPSAAEVDANSRLLRLDALPAARALDLREEALCPGIPPEVIAPARWGTGLFWHAPSDSGRSLVGRWLEARQLAVFVTADHFADVATKLPKSGSLYLELHEPGPVGPIPPGVRWCVASPGLPPAGDVAALVYSPTVAEFASDLLHWVVARLPADGRLDAEHMRAWLIAQASPDGIADSLGDVLWLCGAAHALGSAELGRCTHAQLARRFLRHMVERALDRTTFDLSFLLQSSYPLLLGVIERTLAHSAEPWWQARTVDEWLSLIPAEYQRSTDVDWLRVTLSDAKSEVRPADIERAAKRLPPGPFKLIQGLLQIGVFAPGYRRSALRIRPRWLGSAMATEARHNLTRSGLEWGEALLRPHAARGVFDALLARAARHAGALIEDVLEIDTLDHPAHLTALEASFRAVGLALLSGAAADPDQLQALWHEQLDLLFRRDGELPRPLIGYSEAERDPLLSPAGFFAAALAISERLPLQRVSREDDAALCPWHQTSPPRLLRPLYDELLTLVARLGPAHERLAEGLVSLVDRVRQTIGCVGDGTGEEHSLETPGLLLDEIIHGVASWSSFAKLTRHPACLRSLLHLAHERGVTLDVVTQAAWSTWVEAGSPDELGPLRPSWPGSSELWRRMSAEHVARACREIPLAELAGLVPLFNEPHWTAIFADQGLIERWPEAVRVAPANVVASWLSRSSELNHGLMTALWRHHPALLEARVNELALQHTERAALLMMASGGNPTENILVAAASLPTDRLTGAVLDRFRVWLHELLARRVPGWSYAYSTLIRIERELSQARPAQRAR